MVIPKRIKILYKEYDIKQVENLHDSADDLYGQIDYGTQIIRLDQQYGEDQKKATLLHEVSHGLDDMYCIGLSEKQVKKLGVSLYQLIKDNPEVFKEIKEAE